MGQCTSIMPEYASIYLNVPECPWAWLNIGECPWIRLNMFEYTVLIMPGFSIWLIIVDIWKGFEYTPDIKCARALNMPRYSYNKIIIVTNVIILEFLAAWFVHPGAPQLTNLSFSHELEHKNNETSESINFQ